MKLVRIALLVGLLAASSAGAAEPGPDAAEAARQTMREAMMKQAAMPMRPPVMPMMKPDGRGPAPEMAPPAKGRGDAAKQKAMGSGMMDAGAMRAERAHRAANGSAMGTMKQMSGEMMNAPMMQRSRGMNPGGGMMPGGGSGGGGGMMPGGGGGMAAPGTAQPPASGK